MDQPMPIVRSAVVMQSAAERAVDVALPILKLRRGRIEGFGADVDTCYGVYIVDFRAGVAGLKPLTVRVQATDFKVVWTSDD